MMKAHDHFPMFIEARGHKVILVGGGTIAERRIHTLAKFSFEITVLSDRITENLRKLRDEGRIRYIPGSFDPEEPAGHADLFADACMVLACTDDRNVNSRIGAICKRRGIPVNLCDARDESTFWFPAIAASDELVMGLVGNGRSHETVKKAAAKLRRIIEERLF